MRLWKRRLTWPVAARITTLTRITVPVLMPAVFATTMLSFIKSMESMEIEIVLGVPARIFVFSTLVWDYTHFQPPAYHSATALSSIFLVAVFGLIWLQRMILGTAVNTQRSAAAVIRFASRA